MSTYHDFTVSLTCPDDDLSKVLASWKLGKQAMTEVGGPPTPGSLMEVVDQLEELRHRSLEMAGLQKDVDPEEQRILLNRSDTLRSEMGSALLKVCMPWRERSAILERVAAVIDSGDRVRIEIACDAVLEMFPWELMYVGDPSWRGERYLALHPAISIVRLGDRSQADPAVGEPAPMRVLFVEAPMESGEHNPLSGASLARVGLARPTLEVAYGPFPLVSQVRAELDRGAVNVFHFSGHGRPGTTEDFPVMLFGSVSGEVDPVPATALGASLTANNVKLAVLACCYTGVDANWSGFGADLLGRGVPAVVSMSAPVEDRAADEFARVLYAELARGRLVDEAVSEGRRHLKQQEDEERQEYRSALSDWWLPVLHTRANLSFVPEPGAGVGPVGGGSAPTIRREVGSRSILIGCSDDLRTWTARPWPDRTDGFALSADGDTVAAWGGDLRLGSVVPSAAVKWSGPISIAAGCRAVAVHAHYVVTELLVTGGGGTLLLSVTAAGGFERRRWPETAVAGAWADGGFVWIDVDGGVHIEGEPDDDLTPPRGSSGYDVACCTSSGGGAIWMGAWVRGGELVVTRSAPGARAERRTASIGSVDDGVVRVVRSRDERAPDVVLVVDDDGACVGWTWDDLA